MTTSLSEKHSTTELYVYVEGSLRFELRLFWLTVKCIKPGYANSPYLKLSSRWELNPLYPSVWKTDMQPLTPLLLIWNLVFLPYAFKDFTGLSLKNRKLLSGLNLNFRKTYFKDYQLNDTILFFWAPCRNWTYIWWLQVNCNSLYTKRAFKQKFNQISIEWILTVKY